MSLLDELKGFLPTIGTKVAVLATIGLAGLLLGDLKKLELIGIPTKALEEPTIRLVLMLCVLLFGTLFTLFLTLSHNRKPIKIVKAKFEIKLIEYQEKLLQLLMKCPDITTEQIAEVSKKDLQIIRYHLDELRMQNLISGQNDGWDVVTWKISHYGIEYLVKNKLIET